MIPDCGHFLSEVDIYLLAILGYYGWGKKYWQKFHVAAVPFQHHGVHVYTRLRLAADKVGLPLFVWGANNIHIIEQLKADNVAGIITDRPDLV